MHIRLIAVALAVLTALPFRQDPQTKALAVQPDKENVVASRLAGTWQADAELDQRLGVKADIAEFAFASKPEVLAQVPAAMAKKLAALPILFAGTMRFAADPEDREHPCLLTSLHGNPHLVWFRSKQNDPMGDTESFNLVLARGNTPAQDLLFVGGDFNNQPFRGYHRRDEPAGK